MTTDKTKKRTRRFDAFLGRSGGVQVERFAAIQEFAT
jgi:hypothetical protein